MMDKALKPNSLRHKARGFILGAALAAGAAVATLAGFAALASPASATPSTSVSCAMSGTAMTVSITGAPSSQSSPVVLSANASGAVSVSWSANGTTSTCTGLTGVTLSPTSLASVAVSGNGAEWFVVDLHAVSLKSATYCVPAFTITGFSSPSGFQYIMPANTGAEASFGTVAGATLPQVGSLDSVCSAAGTQDLTADSGVTAIVATPSASGQVISAAGFGTVGALSGASFTAASSMANGSATLTGSTSATSDTLDLSQATGASGTQLVVDTIDGYAVLSTSNGYSSTCSGTCTAFSGFGTIIGSNNVASYFYSNGVQNLTLSASAGASNTLDLTQVVVPPTGPVSVVVTGPSSGTLVGVGSSLFSGFSDFVSSPGVEYVFATPQPGALFISCPSGTCTSAATSQTLNFSALGVPITATFGSTSSLATISGGSTLTFVGPTVLVAPSVSGNLYNVNSIAPNDTIQGSAFGDTLSLGALATSSHNGATVDLTTCSASGGCALLQGTATMYFQATGLVSAAGVKVIDGPTSGYLTVLDSGLVSVTLAGSGTASTNVLDFSGANLSGDTLVIDTIDHYGYLSTSAPVYGGSCPTGSNCTAYSDFAYINGSSTLGNYFFANGGSALNLTVSGAGPNTLDLSQAPAGAVVSVTGSYAGSFNTGTTGAPVSAFSGFTGFVSPAGAHYNFSTVTPGLISIGCGAACVSNPQTLDFSGLGIGIAATFTSSTSTVTIGGGVGATVIFTGVTTVDGSSTYANTFSVNSIAPGDSIVGSTVGTNSLGGDNLSIARLSTSSAALATVDLYTCSATATCSLSFGGASMYFQSEVAPGPPPTLTAGVGTIVGASTGFTDFVLGNPVPVTLNAIGPDNYLDARLGQAGEQFKITATQGTSASLSYNSSIYGTTFTGQVVNGIYYLYTSASGTASLAFSKSTTLNLTSSPVPTLTVAAGGTNNTFDASSSALATQLGGGGTSFLVAPSGVETFTGGSLVTLQMSGFQVVYGPTNTGQYIATFDDTSASGYLFSNSAGKNVFDIGATLQPGQAVLDFNAADCPSPLGYQFCVLPAGSASAWVSGQGFTTFDNVAPSSGGVDVILPAATTTLPDLAFNLAGTSNLLDATRLPAGTYFDVGKSAASVLVVEATAPSSSVTEAFAYTLAAPSSAFPVANILGPSAGRGYFALGLYMSSSVPVTITGYGGNNIIDLNAFLAGTTLDAATGKVANGNGGNYDFSGIQIFDGSQYGGTTFIGQSNSFGLTFNGVASGNTLSYASYGGTNKQGVLFDFVDSEVCALGLSNCTLAIADHFSGIQNFTGSPYSDVFLIDPVSGGVNIFGGGGSDTLDLSQLGTGYYANVNLTSNSLQVLLGGSQTASDNIYSVQNIVDSASGGDTISGDGLTSVITSMGGSNTYNAGTGGLVLLGTGNDTLNLTNTGAAAVSIDLSDSAPQLVGSAYYQITPGLVGTVVMPTTGASAFNVIHGASGSSPTNVVLTGGNNVVEDGTAGISVSVQSGKPFGVSYQVSGPGTSTLTGTPGTDYFIPASPSGSYVTINPSTSAAEILDMAGAPNAVYVNISLTYALQLPDQTQYVSPSGFSLGIAGLPPVGPNTVSGGWGGGVTLNQSSSHKISAIIGSNNNDVLVGSQGTVTITAGLGTSLVVGLGGGDTLIGTGGNTTFETGPGNNTVHGGSGFTTLDLSNGSLCPPSQPNQTCDYVPAQVDLQNGYASNDGYLLNGQPGTVAIDGIVNVIGSQASCNPAPGSQSGCDVLIGGYRPGVLEMGYWPIAVGGFYGSQLVTQLVAEMKAGNAAFCQQYICFSATAYMVGAPNVATVMIGGFGASTTFSSSASGDVVVVNSINASISVNSGGMSAVVNPEATLGVFGNAPTPANPSQPINIWVPSVSTLIEGSGELDPASDTQLQVNQV